MSIKNDLKRKMKDNDYTMDIIEADELIAVWRYRQTNRFKRSVDFQGYRRNGAIQRRRPTVMNVYPVMYLTGEKIRRIQLH